MSSAEAPAAPEISRRQLARMAKVHPTAWAMFLSRYAGDATWENAPHFNFLSDRILRMRASMEEVRAAVKARREPPVGYQRLGVSLPPGFGKSEYLSLAVGSWFLGVRPQTRVVIASYGRDLPMDWSTRARDAMASLGPEVFGVGANSRESAQLWRPRDPETGAPFLPGYFYAVGRGGVFTGKRAEVLIIDDLIKDDEEASSTAIRNKAWRWFLKVAMTRLLPWTIVIKIGTRWHPDDTFGRLEAAQLRGEVDLPWDFVNLPALALENDPLGRELDESLWPAMWSTKRMKAVRNGTDPKTWSALYQGLPVPEGGSLFRDDWERSYEVEGDFLVSGTLRVERASLRVFSTVDLAGSEKTRADWTVIATWGICARTKTLWLLDVVRKRLGAPEIIEAMQEVSTRLQPLAFYVEKTGPQLNLVHALRLAQAAGEKLDPNDENREQDVLLTLAIDKGLPIRRLDPGMKSKVERSGQAQTVMRNGRLLTPAKAPWLAVYLRELYAFPEVKHDDQVDVTGYAGKIFTEVLAANAEAERRAQQGDDLGEWGRLDVGA